MSKIELEKRFFDIRAEKSENGHVLEGYAAKFNKISEELGWFREKIAPGAFKKSIKKSDIRALVDHDSRWVLGRNKADTLKLNEDDTGLHVKIYPPDAQWVRDLLQSIDRGDINQMSFGFVTVKDEWDYKDKNNPTRTLVEAELFDVSVVTFPAYTDTEIALRSFNKYRQQDDAWQTAAEARSRKIRILKLGVLSK